MIFMLIGHTSLLDIFGIMLSGNVQHIQVGIIQPEEMLHLITVYLILNTMTHLQIRPELELESTHLVPMAAQALLIYVQEPIMVPDTQELSRALLDTIFVLRIKIMQTA